MQKNILLTGGAGYVGSHVAYLLASLGYNVIILDKFIHNQRFQHKWHGALIKEDFASRSALEQIFDSYKLDAVMHFAAFIEVGESVKNPKEFYENNVIKTIDLLNFMLEHNVKKFIFSSSCAIYGSPMQIPIDETHPKNPLSPYGKNKLAIEYVLEDYSDAYDLKYVSLRYFNASGACPEIGIGEQHIPETHIIPLLLRSIKTQKPFAIYGTDYQTKDGTAIRDYVHVRDIAQAHVDALIHLYKYAVCDSFNLGTGEGYSVKELVEAAQKVCATKANISIAPRRLGDVAVLVADSSKAYKILNWKPHFSNIEFILKSALKWEELLLFMNAS